MNTARQKILCIEDDLEVAQLFAEELADMGYAVSVAHDGDQGFAAILRDEPDLVLCDVNMPKMTGFELLEKIAGLAPRFADMPFIFVTALGQRDAELKGRRLGADDYVTKPVDFEILETIIQARLARIRREPRPVPVAPLSEREIEILAWSSRGKTSGEIASIVGLSKRTVDFHINNAREKLGVATRIEAVIKAAATGIIKP